MTLKELIEKNNKEMGNRVTMRQIENHLHYSQLSIVEWIREEVESNLRMYGHKDFCELRGKQYKKCGVCVLEDLLLQLNNIQWPLTKKRR